VAATDCRAAPQRCWPWTGASRRREECGGPPTAEQILIEISAVSDRSASHPAASMALVKLARNDKAAETGVLAFEAGAERSTHNSGHEVSCSTVTAKQSWRPRRLLGRRAFISFGHAATSFAFADRFCRSIQEQTN